MTNNKTLSGKKRYLAAVLKGYDSLAVAFSGGVDSTFLLAVAREVLGDRLAAITAESPVHSRRETEEAAALAKQLGVRHFRVSSAEMKLPEFVANPPHRCAVCKRHVFREITRIASRLGLDRVAHGANLDDLQDYRPGLKAAQEMGVLAPLIEAGLTKSDIRTLSRRMRLRTWNKPSMACLASRIPYGDPITSEALRMVERSEEVLQNLGFFESRVRHHGNVARIELAPRDLRKAMQAAMRAEIVKGLRDIGFTHVALDLEGYVQGSLNRDIAAPSSRG